MTARKRAILPNRTDAVIRKEKNGECQQRPKYHFSGRKVSESRLQIYRGGDITANTLGRYASTSLTAFNRNTTPK